MRSLTQYLFEVSKETAESAVQKAVKDVKTLTAQFADSKFKDMDILAKLQRRARQIDVFKEYIENINNETISVFTDDVKKVLDKWNEGRKLSNGAIFRPLFVLTSGEVREWGKRRGWGIGDEWDERNIDDLLKLSYLTVIGLNSDFSNEKKQLSKLNMDTSTIEAVEKEYSEINDELKKDLSEISGLSYNGYDVNRKSSKNEYNTIVMGFSIDKKAIDIEKAAKLLPGVLFTHTGATVLDRCTGSDKQGSFREIYRKRETSQRLN